MPIPLAVAIPAAAGAAGLGTGFVVGRKSNDILLYVGLGVMGYLLYTGKLRFN